MSDVSEERIEIYIQKRNPLKDKLGALRVPTNESGEIDPEKVEEANALISEMCAGCETSISDQLGIIAALWGQMQNSADKDKHDEYAQKIFTASHEIKDIGALCGYTLAAYFAESLRDYIVQTALNVKNQKIIIDAHINAMTVVHRKGIKGDAGPAAEDLKAMVKVAIDKYG